MVSRLCAFDSASQLYTLDIESNVLLCSPGSNSWEKTFLPVEAINFSTSSPYKLYTFLSEIRNKLPWIFNCEKIFGISAYISQPEYIGQTPLL